jgi:Right handed beta helix region
VVEDSSFRGTGDDAIAAWSTTEGAAPPDENNVIRHNTVDCPWLASGIAIYGGKNTLVEDNLVADTGLNGAGIDLSVRFATHPFSGTLTVRRNTLIRTGSMDGDGGRHGALWFDGRGAAGDAAIAVTDLDVFDSTQAAVAFQGPASLGPILISGLLIDTTSVPAVKILEDASGTVEFRNSILKNTPAGGLKNGSSLQVVLGEGNDGL